MRSVHWLQFTVDKIGNLSHRMPFFGKKKIKNSEGLFDLGSNYLGRIKLRTIFSECYQCDSKMTTKTIFVTTERCKSICFNNFSPFARKNWASN